MNLEQAVNQFPTQNHAAIDIGISPTTLQKALRGESLSPVYQQLVDNWMKKQLKKVTQ